MEKRYFVNVENEGYDFGEVWEMDANGQDYMNCLHKTKEGLLSDKVIEITNEEYFEMEKINKALEDYYEGAENDSEVEDKLNKNKWDYIDKIVIKYFGQPTLDQLFN